MKKIQADKNGCKYILFRIDIYFSECFLAVKIDEKVHTDRDIIFELIQVMQKMIYIMRLVMYKHFLMSSKIKK